MNVVDLVERTRRGEPRAIARLITLIEQEQPERREVVERLVPFAGRAHVLGITGPPGVGKSTLTSALITKYRQRGLSVAVCAVDPSSPFTGGALLGDRVRMAEHGEDAGVFIRSMATHGHLGGLMASAPQVVRVFDAAGFAVVIVETVGVGQSEVDVVATADTTVVLLAPGAGDAIQAAKAGILEIADVLVVNKADREGAERTARELDLQVRSSRSLRARDASRWLPPVLLTTASSRGGVDEVVAALDRHRAYLLEGGALSARRVQRARYEIETLTLHQLGQDLGEIGGDESLAALADRVARSELGPYAAADALCRASRRRG